MFLRAVARRSGATPEQIAQIRQALGDRQKIEQLTLFMRKERAHRLIRVQDLGKWIAENWEVILRILGIAIMFLKEAPPEDVSPPAPEIVEKPSTKRSTRRKSEDVQPLGGEPSDDAGSVPGPGSV